MTVSRYMLLIGMVCCGTVETSCADESDAARIARRGILAGVRGDERLQQQLLVWATAADENCELAQWHSGKVLIADEWVTLSEYEQRMAADPTLNEYRQQRDAVDEGKRPELQLAGWCRRQQMFDAEQLHLRQTLADPSASEADKQKAMRRLGLQAFEGQLLTEKEIVGIKQAREQAKSDDAHWTPIVREWKNAIEGQQPRARKFALQELRQLKDPSAIRTLERLLSAHGESLATEVVTVLSQMPEHEATESLVRHGLDAPWDTVRALAIQKLKERPLHDHTPLLLNELASPIQSQFRVGIGDDGMVRRVHQTFQEGSQANRLMTASSARSASSINFAQSNVNATRGVTRTMTRGQAELQRDWAAFNRSLGTPNMQPRLDQLQDSIERERRLAIRRQFIAMEEAHKGRQIEQQVALANQQIEKRNQQVFQILGDTTGADIQPATAVAWWDWWNDYNEMYREQKPTYEYWQGYSDPFYHQLIYPYSCFPAGTQVRTQTGLVPIEKIRPGDRVLSQDMETGKLAYKLVNATTIRPQSDLLRIDLGDEVIATTKGHPFWVNHVGWRMAKRLSPGQRLHAPEGAREIIGIEPLAPAEVYNLVVDDFATYFVGEQGVLVHDNTLRKPTTAIVPGLLAQHVP